MSSSPPPPPLEARIQASLDAGRPADAVRLIRDSAWYPLMRYAVSLTASYDDAEDAVQQGLVQVMRKARAGQLTPPFITRTYSLVRDAIRSERAKESTRREASVNLPILVLDQADKQRATAETRLMLHETLRRLSDESQELAILCHYSGLTWVEIGEIVGLKPDTARRRLERAINDLPGKGQKGRVKNA